MDEDEELDELIPVEGWDLDDDVEDDNPLAVAASVPVIQTAEVAPRRKQRKGNTSRSMASAQRRDAIREATGQGYQDPDAWRTTLADGDRGKAASQLASGRSTHNSDSGFGLA